MTLCDSFEWYFRRVLKELRTVTPRTYDPVYESNKTHETIREYSGAVDKDRLVWFVQKVV